MKSLRMTFCEVPSPITNRQHLITDPIFIVGNGNSRKDFDLNFLKEKGTIIGCNALYRTFSPDILVVMNFDMMDEVFDYAKNHFCITLKRNTHTINRIKQWKVPGVNSSGCLAIKLVSLLMKPSKCYMLGMDGCEGNIYNDTRNYSKGMNRNLDKMFKHNIKAVRESKITKFINVNLTDSWPENTAEFMTYKDFKGHWRNR